MAKSKVFTDQLFQNPEHLSKREAELKEELQRFRDGVTRKPRSKAIVRNWAAGEQRGMRLLRSEIERAGGQVQWAKMWGVNRPNLNKVLQGRKPLSKSIIKALKLRIVFCT